MHISEEIRIPLLGEDGDLVASYRLVAIAFYGHGHYYGRACEFLSDQTSHWTEYNDMDGVAKDGYVPVKVLGNIKGYEDLRPGFNVRMMFYARRGGLTEATRVNIDTLRTYVQSLSVQDHMKTRRFIDLD